MVVGEKNHPLYRKHRCWILFKGHLCKTGDDVFKHDKTRGYWSLIMQNQRWIDKDRLLLNGSFQYLVYEHKQEPSITLKPQNLIEPSHKSKNKIGAWVPFCTGFKKKGKSLQASNKIGKTFNPHWSFMLFLAPTAASETCWITSNQWGNNKIKNRNHTFSCWRNSKRFVLLMWIHNPAAEVRLDIV